MRYKANVVRKTALCCGASLTALFAAQSANAQTVAEQPASVQPSPTSTESEDIVVTGYRASLAAALRLKRNASSVVEAITSEDLGKFTDNSIADAIQRVPGVQIERNDGGQRGDRVSIRGLGPAFVTTTVNGRVVSSYGSEGINQLRSFNLEVLPTEVLSGTVIYKSPTAELIESGLAGEVDFQTLRPLDYRVPSGKPFFGSITGRIQDDSQTSDVGGRVSGIFGGKLADDTFAFFVSGLYDQTDIRVDELNLSTTSYRDVNIRQANGSVQITRNVLYPDLIAAQIIDQPTKRIAASGGIQWRPTPTLEVNADYTFSQFDRLSDRQSGQVSFIGANGTVTNGIFDASGINIENGAVNFVDLSRVTSVGGSNTTAAYTVFNYIYDNFSKTQAGGINVAYKNDGWTAKLDYSHSNVRYYQDLSAFIGGGLPLPNSAGVSYDARGSGPAIVGLGQNSVTTPGTLDAAFFFKRIFQNRTDLDAIKADVARDLTPDFTLKFGGRYQRQKVEVRSAINFIVLTPAQQAAVQPVLFPGQTLTIFPNNPIGLNNIQLARSRAAFEQFPSIVPAYDPNSRPFSGDFFDTSSSGAFSFDPSSYFSIVEETSAAYGQIDGRGALGGLAVEGNIGLRAVNTNENARAFQAVTIIDPITQVPIGSTQQVPTTARNNYWTFLPSANLTVHPLEAMNIRFAVARTMTRPEFDQLAPRNVINLPDPANPASANVRGTGSAGNTQLKPQTSWNYDLTAEYYGPKGSAYILSFFYKDVSNFIYFDTAFGQTLPGQGNQLFNLTQVTNVSKGRAYGFEAGITQPFSFLPSPFDGFGVQANYTYVNSRVNASLNGQAVTFPGASKHNVNATIFFEKGPFGVRTSYSYRSNYLASLANGLGLNALPTYTQGFGSLDASATLKVGNHLDVTLTGSNLAGENRRDYTFDTSNFREFFSRSRRVALAIRLVY